MIRWYFETIPISYSVDFDGLSWIQYYLFCKNKLQGSSVSRDSYSKFSQTLTQSSTNEVIRRLSMAGYTTATGRNFYF